MAVREPSRELIEALARGDLVVIAGAGVTKATVSDSADWADLLTRFMDDVSQRVDPQAPNYGRAKQRVEFATTYKTAKDFIEAAEEIFEQFGNDELERFLISTFSALEALDQDDAVLTAIDHLDCPTLTTNYDVLIATHRGKVPQVLATTGLAAGILRNVSQDVLHIHGHCRAAGSMIVTRSGYDRILESEQAQDLLTTLMTKTVLFVGCGATLDDPNLNKLYQRIWDRTRLDPNAGGIYRLATKGEEKGIKTYEGVRVVQYGDDFADLAPYLEQIVTARQSVASAVAATPVRDQGAVQSQPMDIEVKIANDTVHITCSKLSPSQPFGVGPDWARITSLDTLDGRMFPGLDAFEPPTDEQQRLGDAELLGNHLLMMYGRRIARALTAVQTNVDLTNCRLVLDITDPRAEARLWEGMFSQGHLDDEPPRDFLANMFGYSIVRKRKSAAANTFPARRSAALGILIAVCDPDDELKAQDLVTTIEAVGLSPSEVDSESPERERRSFNAFQIKETLRRWEESSTQRMDVLHIVAVVQADGQGRPILQLGRQDLPAQEFQQRVIAGPPPRLVVLQLKPRGEAGSGLVLRAAADVSRSGVPNVLVLHHGNGVASPNEHLRGLYEHLNKGCRLDKALMLARSAYEQSTSGTTSLTFPALFLQLGTEDVMALELEQSGGRSDKTSTPSPTVRGTEPRGSGPGDVPAQPAQGEPAIAYAAGQRSTVLPTTKQPESSGKLDIDTGTSASTGDGEASSR